MSFAPLVSVCVPVYNGERFLQPTLESLAKQDYESLEIVLLDNASKDGSLALLQRFQKEHPALRIRLHRNESVLPLSENWNKALSLGEGELIKLLPCDDTLAPNCISEQAAILRENAEVGFTTCGKWLIGPRGGRMIQVKPSSLGICEPPVSAKEWLRSGRNVFGEPGAVLFRRSVLEEVGGGYDPNHLFLLDYDLHLRMARRGPFYGLGAPLVGYRLHGWSGTSHNKDRTVREFRALINKHAPGEFTEAEIAAILKRVVFYDWVRTAITRGAMFFR